jgi:small redox-active disulfide protein 2
MKIEILGIGCPKCKATEKNARKAIEALGISAEIEKVTDINEISNKVMMTPAVIVDGELKCAGRIPSEEEIKGWLRQK